MSVHTEWAGARSCGPEVVAPRQFTDDNGSTNDEWCLLMGSNSVFAIEGSLDDLEALADSIKAAVLKARS